MWHFGLEVYRNRQPVNGMPHYTYITLHKLSSLTTLVIKDSWNTYFINLHVTLWHYKEA